MKWAVDWERRARRQMEELAQRQPDEARRIAEAVRRFAEEGVGDVKKLQGQRPTTWRLRAGSWRIRFRMEGDQLRVVAVTLRRDAYD